MSMEKVKGLVVCFGKDGREYYGYLMYVPCERVVVLRDSYDKSANVVLAVQAVNDVQTYRTATPIEKMYHAAVIESFKGINILSFAI